ncbi:hypothetical protein L7F22_014351 [Adiantum nelumboides]|nr:hypothetical protein [Adiantum nelumboides]
MAFGLGNSPSLSFRCNSSKGSVSSRRRCDGPSTFKHSNSVHLSFSEPLQPTSPYHSNPSSDVIHASPPHTAELPRAFRPSQRELPHGLDAHLLPGHVAIIMDGNSRWAERKGFSCAAGHEAGAKSLKDIVRLSYEWGLAALTVFAFSIENWHRGQVEISFLMQLFQKVLTEELDRFVKENIQVGVIGDTRRLPLPLQSLIHEVQQKTAHNTGLKFTIAASYSGRYDIVQACQRVAADVQQGKLNPEDITERHVEEQLGTSWIGDIGNPDLLIRTSGEQRLSNFLLWQLAYTELFFMDVMWPDLDEMHYANALLYFQRRHRRYGRRPHVSTP